MVAPVKWFRGHRGIVLGVYGGAFDPPHLGHALLPGYVLAAGWADHILVAPCADHPLGKSMRPFETRLAMVRAAMRAYGPHVEVTDLERRLAETQGGPSVTLRLLDAIAAQHPDQTIRLIVGSDITATGETARWHRWDEIERKYPPLVVPRAGYAEPDACALPELASRELRAWLASADPADHARARNVVPGAVWPWIDPAPAHTRHVVLVGRGNVTTHVQAWLRARGDDVEVVSGHEAAAGRVRVTEGTACVWVLVGDPTITDVATGLVGRVPPGTPVLHGAGARRAADVLAPLRAAGHAVGTLHPICALRKELPWPSYLAQAAFGLEGDPTARQAALALVGGQPWLDLQDLDDDGRRAYHGACALVANHLAVLRHGAAEVLRAQGHDPATVDAALDSLLRSSLENLAELGIPGGITGPVARGDAAAVAAHLRALPEPAASLYGELSRRLADLVASTRATVKG